MLRFVAIFALIMVTFGCASAPKPPVIGTSRAEFKLPYTRDINQAVAEVKDNVQLLLVDDAAIQFYNAYVAPGFLGQRNEVNFLFKETANGTECSCQSRCSGRRA